MIHKGNPIGYTIRGTPIKDDNRRTQWRAQNRDYKGNQMRDPIRDHKKPLRPRKVPIISKDPNY